MSFEPWQIYAAGAGVLFCIGLRGLLNTRELLRKVMAVNVMGGGAFLLLVSIARRNFAEHPDPVPHAMVLTGIVVAISATALAIGLLRLLAERTGSVSLDEGSD